ncbi:hypothetical protein KFU94_50920 [Chloroflexi bacterium TSY]|nr:hypothetical protein [Chloroflexi bacterium TSY]
MSEQVPLDRTWSTDTTRRSPLIEWLQGKSVRRGRHIGHRAARTREGITKPLHGEPNPAAVL